MKKNIKQYFKNNKSYFAILFQQKQYENLISYIFEDYILRWIFLIISFLYHNLTNSKFVYNNQKYSYNKHKYNLSWGNERAVEIPIVLNFINFNNTILEIGNVLSYYCQSNWHILDKFEKYKSVINKDLFNYSPLNKFDQIVSISTIEHVGVDDSVSNPQLGINAIKHIKSLLKSGGDMLITIPIGYNQILDRQFIKKGIFDSVYALKRVSILNKWKQISIKEVRSIKYGWPYNNGNAILVGYYKKP